mmetsp:Transcript_130806/g.406764  ORF Transcript_130806/g.406764 Transcript_130806/m.406764 type:complete len:267 (+) Transcript_130806:192-992(+)
MELVEQGLAAPQDVALKPLDVHLHHVHGGDALLLQQPVQRAHLDQLACGAPLILGVGVARRRCLVCRAFQDSVAPVVPRRVKDAHLAAVLGGHQCHRQELHAISDVRVQAERCEHGLPVDAHWLHGDDVVAHPGKHERVPAQVGADVDEGAVGRHGPLCHSRKLARMPDLPVPVLRQPLRHDVHAGHLPQRHLQRAHLGVLDVHDMEALGYLARCIVALRLGRQPHARGQSKRREEEFGSEAHGGPRQLEAPPNATDGSGWTTSCA